eukprot:TRINITY_DN15456_c0_g3_i5.p1 TRINITY_DN15456_c0_g3~~TRINITY_DN15456_c0_g3_i5.p1  ORF type:complete len:167 (-),score=10.24 TRINITY_DN15456_c0_g3_i5:262-762(-)
MSNCFSTLLHLLRITTPTIIANRDFCKNVLAAFHPIFIFRSDENLSKNRIFLLKGIMFEDIKDGLAIRKASRRPMKEGNAIGLESAWAEVLSMLLLPASASESPMTIIAETSNSPSAKHVLLITSEITATNNITLFNSISIFIISISTVQKDLQNFLNKMVYLLIS